MTEGLIAAPKTGAVSYVITFLYFDLSLFQKGPMLQHMWIEQSLNEIRHTPLTSARTPGRAILNSDMEYIGT